MTQDLYTIITAQQMRSHFAAILLKNGFTDEKATQCADIFTANSIDGVYTHGINRFPDFIKYVRNGFVLPDAEPSQQQAFGSIEQWNGNLGPGMLNAVKATGCAMSLSQKNGIGCVAMANTNHWMRGGYYGWQAARAGYIFIGWTNTYGIMPAYNAKDSRLGNNPLVMAIPYQDEAIVLDMAMSQFSYGAMKMACLKNESLPVIGGFDEHGIPTDDPGAILHSRRPMAIGHWKGAGLALLLDILATVLSAGLSTYEITQRQSEYAVSQVFIAIDMKKLNNHPAINETIQHIIDDYKNSTVDGAGKNILFPGERVMAIRKRNLADGIPVLNSVWEKVLAL